MNKWEELDKKYIWHPFTQMKDWTETEQLVIERGEGVKLYDTGGREYYDGVSSLWVNIHGHRRGEIDRAVKNQIDKIAHSSLLGLINQPSAELAERLVRIMPPGLCRVFYSDDGSTAVEAAIKIAFQYWRHQGRPEKRRFINLADSYHGDTVGAVSVGNIDAFHRAYRDLLFGTTKMSCPSFFHRKNTGLKTEGEFLAFLLEELESYLKENAGSTAAMVVEPLVQAAAGMLIQPAGYLRGIRDITRRHGVLLIVDEVATGFGRTGGMFACEREEVSPDIICLSKGITAGYLPLGATITTGEIYNAFLGEYTDHKTFYHGHSYTGNPLACAAGVASLDIFERDRVIENLPPKIAVIAEHLRKIAGMEFTADVRHLGMLAGIELARDRDKRIPFDPALLAAAGVCRRARHYGLITRNIGDVIVFMPPLASTEAEIDDMLSRLERAMDDAFRSLAAGFTV
ncbi:MAG: adenosylmethionine--8-amino-7-oxononanoate transaminase [Treponema sp.]|jgi:adenosylmethionine-8-amino-7-oxononanoate aminotransferase|nr:adenosylmethionine--8-amino-7-oxononanoate transaminase [Treponema sp.]